MQTRAWMPVAMSVVVVALGSSKAVAQIPPQALTYQLAFASPFTTSDGNSVNPEFAYLTNSTAGAFSGNSSFGAGLWSWSGGSVTQLVLRNAPAPGTGRSFTGSATGVHVAPNQFLFSAQLFGVNNAAVYVQRPDGIELIGQQGTPVPGMAGEQFESLAPRAANANGVAVLGANLQGPGVTELNRGIAFRYDGAQITPLIRQGDLLPGINLPADRIAPLAVTNQGDVLSTMASRSFSEVVDRGIWVLRANGQSINIVPTGLIMPGTGSSLLQSVSAVQSSRNGDVAFSGQVSGDTNTNTALWRRTTDGTMKMIVRAGSAVPGIAGWSVEGEQTNNTDLRAHSIGQSGRGVFMAQMGPTNDRRGTIATFDASGAVQIVAREEEGLVGTSLVLGNASPFFTNVNARDQFAMLLQLHQAGTIGGFIPALYAWDPSAGLLRIAGVGDAITFADGVTRTVTFVSLTRNDLSSFELSRGSLFDNGELLVQMGFSNGTSGLVSVFVPAPGAAALLMIGAFCTSNRRCRPRL